MRKTYYMMMLLCGALAACSQESSKHNTPDAVSAVAHALDASQAAPTVSANSVPQIANDASPKEQVQALHDLMQQFSQEAAQRSAQWRSSDPQPSQSASLALIRQEAAAIQADAKRLQQLNLTDADIRKVRDDLAQSMLLFSETAELQVRSNELSAENKQEELHKLNQQLGEKIVQSQAKQQQSEAALQQLLQQHQLKP